MEAETLEVTFVTLCDNFCRIGNKCNCCSLPLCVYFVAVEKRKDVDICG